ncbi:hypothetical protein SAMN00017405_0410 [Desulfonispora thiosulfatigenes DSM 11270]|uniref:Uncharacterized protein n=1 Tax=Desulfonispora thiosulfatigenes DSM 11270 TaxID=656914 RepID=A0A1W1VQ40_DESTI|nr:hypothetical protein [Desulfonispora thiosulfatigenes]SMB95467.1 hypothetical protein SAMN00017405_0410 [Desulfonispora thiosulfatigenes DSM 11270]
MGVVVKMIPFKNFKEKINIVREEESKGSYVQIIDGKYIYSFKKEENSLK